MSSFEHKHESFWQKLGKFCAVLVNAFILLGNLAAAALAIYAVIHWLLTGQPFP